MPDIICRLIRLMGLGQYWNVLSLGAKPEDAVMVLCLKTQEMVSPLWSLCHSQSKTAKSLKTFPRGIIYHRYVDIYLNWSLVSAH